MYYPIGGGFYVGLYKDGPQPLIDISTAGLCLPCSINDEDRRRGWKIYDQRREVDKPMEEAPGGIKDAPEDIIALTGAAQGLVGLGRIGASETIAVTHRGTIASIEEKVAQGILPANFPVPNNALTRFIDHSKPAVWVSEGGPTIWNRIFSGMSGPRGQAAISFEIEKGLVKRPDGIKGLFGPSQRVIEQNVAIPANANVKVGRRWF